MKATLLCTFENVDMADIAVGKLRAKVPGIDNIEISKPYFGEPEDDIDFVPLAGALGGLSGVAVNPSSNAAAIAYMVHDRDDDRHSDYAPQNVTVRVTCLEGKLHDVQAQLINLGALKMHAVTNKD